LTALNVAKNANPSIYIKVNDDKLKKDFADSTEVYSSLLRAGSTTILSGTDADPEGCLKSFVNDKVTIYIKVVGLIDIKLEIERVNKRNK